MPWSSKKKIIVFFIMAYALFFGLLGMTGGAIALGAPPIVQDVMKNVCAWAPTFAVLMLFRKLYPGLGLSDYLKRHFAARTRPSAFLVPLAIQAAILVLAVLAYCAYARLPLASLKWIDPVAILPAILISLTAGPLGEELGWRGFAFTEIREKRSSFSASIIVGLVWGFWHLPLWLLSGFKGMELLAYIAFFILGILSLSVMIAAFYGKGGNILIAVWIHFLFNFLMQLPRIDILPLLAFVSVGYAAAAALIALGFRKTLFRKPEAAAS